MQITSRAYKTEQKGYLRNEQYIWIYLGIISKEAQANAVINGDFVPFSEPQLIFDSTPFEAYYVTAERNFARCDGSQYFLPRDSSLYGLYQGAVTKENLGSVTFTFGQYHHLNLKGLTINFGDFYPTEFEITNGDQYNTYRYTKNNNEVFVCEDEFLNTDWIRITPISMVNGAKKLRILSMLFGVVFLFDNNELISTSWKSEVAHLSDALPSKSLTFTINNLSRKFSSDNPHSFMAFLQEQQDVDFEYGRKVNDEIFRIPGGKLKLSAWSSDDTQAKFTAVGNLDFISATYKRGQYYENGISLYDLAVDVCQDAGIEDYVIDSYLKKLITHNPLPIQTHKNLLQLIANSALAILRETRSGAVQIKTSFKPKLIRTTTNGHMFYSDLTQLVSENNVFSEYASAEKNFTYANGSLYFMPRNQSVGIIYSGFVSYAVSNSNGYFATNPRLTFEWEASWTFFNFSMIFSKVCPLSITIHTYYDNTEKETIVVDDIDLKTVVEHDFYEVDKITIEFTRTNPYQRIHLGRIVFGDITDYTLSYMDMSTSPVSARTEDIRNINVVYTDFSYGSDVKSIGTVQTVIGENESTFNTAYHDYSLAYKEIKDNTTQYKKASKVICDALPPIDTAKTNTKYLVRKNNGYDMYVVHKENSLSTWQYESFVTEVIVNSLPSTLDRNTLYLIQESDKIYHLYMYDGEIKSLGYDVRGTLRILESGAYYIKYSSDVASPVVISGIAFLIVESTFIKNLHELGVDKTAKNVLIDNITLAEKEADWIGEYYDNDVEYTISYRGEPALDPDDQIFLENKFVERNIIRITSTQIDTSTGMSMNCSLKARRTDYQEFVRARVDYAIVDVSEVGE